jgi:hypothetical protein
MNFVRMLCFIALLSGIVSQARQKTGTPTFARDVAPILLAKCVSCHYENGPAPFALTNYTDAKRRDRQIAVVTQSGFMPPGNVAPESLRFHDLPRLTTQEKATLRQWADSGAEEGDPKQTPKPPVVRSRWRLGEPDLVLKMPQPYTLSATARVVYRSFVIPTVPNEDVWVRAVEILPGNLRAVRQAFLYVDTTGTARKLEAQSGAVGYTDFCSGLKGEGQGSLSEWTPGLTPRFLPEGVGIKLPKGADLVLQLRFQPSGKPETEQTEIGLTFHKLPPVNALTTIRLGLQTYYLQPGKKSVISDTLTLPVAVNVYGLIANAHPVCTEVKASVTLPDGTNRVLLCLPDWDANWKRPYRLETALTLPTGSMLSMEYLFDNTRTNPRNPRPHTIRPGLLYEEEMASLWVQAVPERPEDAAKLAQALKRPGHRPTVTETGKATGPQ